MQPTARAIRSDLHRLRASWIETLFCKTHIARLEIIDMKIVHIEVVMYKGVLSGDDYGSTIVEYCIYLDSPQGHLCIKVSPALFEFLETGDQVVVKYRQNRAGFFWGQIAR